MMRRMALGLAITLGLLGGWAGAQAQGQKLSLQAVSNRPDLVSGGDVLVRARVPREAQGTAFISLMPNTCAISE